MVPGPGTTPKRRGIFYGWWLVGLSLLLTGMTSGAIWGSVGVWLKTLELQFSWTRTQMTGAFSMAQLEGSIVGPLAGYFVDRLGPRLMVLFGAVVVGLGFILFSRTPNLPVFYVAFALFMLGASTGTWLPTTAAVSRWFNRRRATAVAIAAEGNYMGGLLLVPVLAWAVGPESFGWRVTALGIGVAFLAIAVPAAMIMRNSPEEYGEVPDGRPAPPSAPLSTRAAGASGGTGGGPPPPGATDFTAAQAMRTQAFWLITFGHAVASMVNQTLGVHLVPLLTDQGLSLQMAAYMWAVIMGAAMASSLVAGYMGDRIPKNLGLFFFVAIQVTGFGMAVLIQGVPLAVLVAIIYGIGFGGRNPLAVAIRADYFGQRAFATITGLSMAPMFFLQLVAPLFAAAMFDWRGSYTIAFVILTILGVVGALLFLPAKKPAAPPPRASTDFPALIHRSRRGPSDTTR